MINDKTAICTYLLRDGCSDDRYWLIVLVTELFDDGFLKYGKIGLGGTYAELNNLSTDIPAHSNALSSGREERRTSSLRIHF